MNPSGPHPQVSGPQPQNIWYFWDAPLVFTEIMKQVAAFLSATVTVLAATLPALAEPATVGSTLQAGELKPPEAVQSETNAAPTSQTEAQLDRADKEDSGRGLEFVYLNAEAGPEYLGLHTLKANQLVDGSLVKSKGAGMVYGAGLGVRLLAFTLGACFRYGNFSDWHVWTLGAEAGMHIPLGRIEPYVTLGAGYAALGGYQAAVNATGPQGQNVRGAAGLDVRGSAGVDFYLSNTFSVGANLSGDVLFLSRSADRTPLQVPTDPNRSTAWTGYQLDGSGIGVGGTLSAVLGLHF